MTHAIDQAIFDVAKVLEVPVLILALLALAAAIVELGAFGIELRVRRRRHVPTLTASAKQAREALSAGNRDGAVAALHDVAWSSPMGDALDVVAEVADLPGGDTRIAKALADFDWDAQQRLGRTRLLVRAGPALGLMGTLIPLSPALDGLASGKVDELSRNLRVAFSVTVLGLLVGAIAYGLSLYRDRIYGQDLSDLEYVAAVLTDAVPPAEPRIRPVEIPAVPMANAASEATPVPATPATLTPLTPTPPTSTPSSTP